MNPQSIRCGAVIALLLGAVASAQFQVPTGFVAETVWGGPFPGASPTDMEILPDGRLIVVTKQGEVLLFLPTGGAPTLIGNLPTTSAGDQGICGVALDPGVESNGHVFIYWTPSAAPFARLSRFTLSGDLNDRLSTNLVLADEHVVLDTMPNSDPQHQGGGLDFAPDGTLVLALGDDRDDCESLDLTSLLGVVLRMDVSALPAGPGGPPAITSLAPADNPFVGATDPIERLVIAWGLRNPWSMQLDPVTGMAYIADVGAGTSEEIDRLDLDPAGPFTGVNFGWPEMEGTFPRTPCTPGNPVPPLDHEPPIFELLHANGAIAGILAGLYRNDGRVLDFGPGYEGDLFVSDWGAGTLHRLRDTAGTWAIAPPEPGQPSADAWGAGFYGVAQWKKAPDGSLYFMRTGAGLLGRIRPAGLDHEIICEPTAGVPGSIDIAFRGVGGTPGNTCFYGLAVDNPGVAPNGWFFGIDITIVEIQTQLDVFLGVFDGVGQFELRIPLGALPCPLGLTLDAVLLEFGAGGTLSGQSPARTLTF